jgi:hypothetical protein
MFSLKQLAGATGRSSASEIEQLRGRLRRWAEGEWPIIRPVKTGGRNKRYAAEDVGVIALADRLMSLGLSVDAIHILVADRTSFDMFYNHAVWALDMKIQTEVQTARIALYRVGDIDDGDGGLWGKILERDSLFEEQTIKLSHSYDVIILNFAEMLRPYRSLIEAPGGDTPDE